MKKKILFSLIVIALFFLSFTGVYAAEGDTYTPTTKAKNISFTPGADANVVALMDNVEFKEFNKYVKFNAVGSVDQITPRSDLTKILISFSPNYEAAVGDDFGLSKKATDFVGADDRWFTAYCLDPTLKYPQVGLENYNKAVIARLMSETWAEYSTSELPAYKYDQLIAAVAMMALANDKKFNDLLTNYIKGKGYDGLPIIAYKLQPNGNVITFGSTTAPAAADLQAAGVLMSKLKKIPPESVDVYVDSITFYGLDGSNYKVTGNVLSSVDPANAAEDGTYKITINSKDILFDKYSVTKLGGDNTYNHALWIIEHSYPSMTIDDLLTSAGATKTDFVNEIMALYPNNTFTDDIKENLYDNYVYYTVQYAIWKANKYMPDGHELGDTLYLKGEANNTLNKIYQHLIKDRDEYKNYGNNKYSDKITFDKTNNDKIKTTKDAYIYGPYYASFNVINPGDINLVITNADKKGISIVDANEKEITKVPSGGEFYIKCLKSAKITNVSIKGTASGTSYDDSEKGAIYYANYALSQNVISGLKYMTIAGSGEDSFAYNPKTGVPNVAIVFIITLVAFSLGYLALSYNNKAVELN